ncbi:Purine efflux pump PbuE [Sporomusa silvacetica DSM 10669]|uniref:Purine efflux pump PbuE n=1 Tax=Sporomusa silvacetica DSM 10669 TaxID=1123289 RepID=A0ABZ3IFK0_9FIRM|nr:MFS transporter [Sporomusa silvacetica]OZC17113.1 purine efflux pump PbuE [Sporomusa silvacetica DSM 10669]
MNNTWKIYMLAIISFLVGTSQFVIVGILDKVAASVGVSVSSAGQLITVFALASAIGTPLVMVATTKMNQGRQLLLALAILLLGILTMLVFQGFGFLMASRAILGVGTGVFIVTAYSITANLASAGNQGKAMSNISMGFSASLVFGVPIGRVIAAAYDWQTIFWGIGLFALLGMLGVAWTILSTAGEPPKPLSMQVAQLKKPNVAIALGITFFVFIGYSVVNTYIVPLLASIRLMSEQEMSSILFSLGIASLVGSKLGGFLADRIGITRTLVGSMIVQALALALLSITSGSSVLSVILIMLWATSAWTFGLTQSFNIVSLAPEASGIMLSLNSSFVQLGFAAGAGIGGLAVGGSSVMIVSWIGAASVAVAACIAAFSFGLVRSLLIAR